MGTTKTDLISEVMPTSPDNTTSAQTIAIGVSSTAEDVVYDSQPVPVVGLGTFIFPSIHGTALASLTISIIASIGVLTFMFTHRPKEKRTLWSRTIAERLVIYLALGDLLFSVTHAVDHAVMLAIAGNPPRPACITIAFFMLSFYYSPSVIALFTAINAFAMVVLQRKLNLGKYDWRLLALAFAAPFLFMVTAASLRYLGASGIACSFYLGSSGGRMMGQIFSISMVAGCLINLTCYTLVWLRIRQSPFGSQASRGRDSVPHKTRRSARVMLIFVLAYFAQNWSVVIYYTWGFFGYPPLALVYLVVTFVNMGGVFNMFAYTVLRRWYNIIDVSSDSMGSTRTTRKDNSTEGRRTKDNSTEVQRNQLAWTTEP